MRKDYMPRTKETIYQEKGIFAFSLDSVLLAGYAEARGRLLDLGSGSGYLALEAAHKADRVWAVDIEPRACDLLRRSAEENGRAIEVVCGDFRALDIGKFDTIWTNPPFYRRSLIGDTSAISKAKHLEEGMCWFKEAARLLKPGGMLYAIVDAASFQAVVQELSEAHLALVNLRPVYWRRGEEARRFLFSAKAEGGFFLHVNPPLVIYEGNGYTEEVARYYGR